MNRREEIRDLKRHAVEIQARLDFLEMRINSIGRGIPAASRLKATVDVEKCAGCGICQEVCPVDAIEVDDCAQIQMRLCTGCGRCVQECPQEALSLRSMVFAA